MTPSPSPSSGKPAKETKSWVNLINESVHTSIIHYTLDQTFEFDTLMKSMFYRFRIQCGHIYDKKLRESYTLQFIKL
jgi:hypothetical protein